MPARRKLLPSYLLHRQAGCGRAVWTDATGTRRYVQLPGAYNSPESLAAFARLQAELAVAPHAVPAVAPPGGRALAEVLLAFWTHADAHYRRAEDGRPTSELREYKLIIRLLRERYGTEPADNFGPLALKAVRQTWVSSGLARSEVNRRVNMVRRLFKWAAGEELIRFDTYHRLTAVAGLQKGRAARETEPVAPVDDATVNATLPFLNRHPAGVIEFQRLTGCRPGEACRVRPCHINTNPPVWLYHPPHHKNAHRGKPRVIAIGPKAQSLLKSFAPADPEAYYFSPAAAVAELHAARWVNRKEKSKNRPPSRIKRNAAKRVEMPKRPPAERYTSASLSRAVARAVKKANADRERKAAGKPFDPIPHWHPNQLRHAHATAVREKFGLEAAQAALGHAKADVTQIYAERNTKLASHVAAEIG